MILDFLNQNIVPKTLTLGQKGGEQQYSPGFFLDVLKKTQARKNSKLKQNTLKLKRKFRKNSKTANST